jgi:glycosyltransferase involved in cell wall biosynthesis
VSRGIGAPPRSAAPEGVELYLPPVNHRVPRRLSTRQRQRVVWLYYGNHLQHPFIRLASETLVHAGHSLSVIDGAPDSAQLSYAHLPVSLPPLRDAPGFLGRARKWSGMLRGLLAMLYRTIRARPDTIIATVPHAAMVAWLAASGLRSRLVYYPFELFGEQSGPAPWVLRSMEKLLLRRVDAMITQNEARSRFYRDERGARVMPAIVHNYKAARTASPNRRLAAALGLPASCDIILYEGQLTGGRWLDRLIRAAAYLPSRTRLVLMGERMPWWDVHGEQLLSDPQVAGRVLVAPFVPHEELLDYVAGARVGVIIYDDQVRNNYYCEPGKLSDYVMAGVPVVGPDFPTLGPVIRDLGIGRSFAGSDPEVIAQAISEVLEIPAEEWQAALARAKPLLAWETQQAAFLQAVTGADFER